MSDSEEPIRWLESVTAVDVPEVGSKNAALGEMLRALPEVRIPGGFATTADGYRAFLRGNHLDERIPELLADYRAGVRSLDETSRSIRRLFYTATLPTYLAEAIRAGYRALCRRYAVAEVDVAVRSSATAEDLPEASFAGQQESFLNVRGEEELLDACRKCYGSLFTSRAVAYREQQGVSHLQVALSIGVQKMVRADEGGAGVLFTLDTESGFPGVVLINAAWGLGETVVQGTVNPDQYMVFKPLLDENGYVPIIEKKLGSKDKKVVCASGGSRLTKSIATPLVEQHRFVLEDEEILQLARWAVAIERHYGRAMDVEWAKDGRSGELFVVQARPETVHAQAPPRTFRTYHLRQTGRRLLTGLSIGSGVARGPVCRVLGPEDLRYVRPGCIVVAEMTEPDWVPVMRHAAGIITDFGGRTCHAAIVSRELGVPAVVGTGEATQLLVDDQEVTLSCAAGEVGFAYDGFLDYDVTEIDLEDVPATRTELLLDCSKPDGALKWWRMPAAGVGLARLERLIGEHIQIHPMALAHFDALPEGRVKREVRLRTRGYEDRAAFFVDHVARGIAKIAACQYPRPVFVSMSDWQTDASLHLVGRDLFEPEEPNPKLGWRGASRYYGDGYRDGFRLECMAVKTAREVLGFSNIIVTIPFCRTPEEADRVLEEMAAHGLERGTDGLQVYMLCAVPANVVLIEEFARRFDGFFIAADDLAQLVLGIDAGADALALRFDDGHEAVRSVVAHLVARVHALGRPVGFCGQRPGLDPEYMAFLVGAGVDALTLAPDALAEVKRRVAKVERDGVAHNRRRRGERQGARGSLGSPQPAARDGA